tara:strand:+ start:273 stop:557 length:285 start_codon:yes stop_codon:yes gene_type:complete
MFTFDRDTAMIVAVIMCIAASVYMYKELKTTKEEMEGVKGMNGKMASFLSRVRPIQISNSVPDTPINDTINVKNETQVDTESEENQESEEDSSE